MSMGQATSTSGRKEEALSNVHFVLKTPLRPPFPEGLATAVFATGCYWGTEKGYWRLPGVFSTAVGYAGGKAEHPTYEEACSGRTGHTEAVFVVYDPEQIAYSDLLRMFYESHDPSTLNRQGNDRGTQYRSAIYTYNDEQMGLAVASKAAFEKILGRPVVSELKPMEQAGPFYYAHEEYQQYLARPGSRPYCSAQPQGKSLGNTWVPEELAKHAPKLSEEFWQEHSPKPGCHTVIKCTNPKIVWPAA